MKITKFFRFSNYIQIVNGRLINKPLPLLKNTNNDKEKEKEKEKESINKDKPDFSKSGFPWE